MRRHEFIMNHRKQPPEWWLLYFRRALFREQRNYTQKAEQATKKTRLSSLEWQNNASSWERDCKEVN